MNDLTALSPVELLRLNAATLNELRRRDIIQSQNAPLGDFAEHLFCRAFGWTQQANSQAGYDAVDENGVTYQIKSRRISARNPSRQLSAIRNIETKPFDHMAGVLFDENYTLIGAAIVPVAVVIAQATFVAHTNSYRFHLRPGVWEFPDVLDVTDTVAAALHGLEG